LKSKNQPITLVIKTHVSRWYKANHLSVVKLGMGQTDETLKNFIYKHTKHLEIVQRNKKKAEVTGGCQVTPN
jgi:hypothetical protein